MQETADRVVGETAERAVDENVEQAVMETADQAAVLVPRRCLTFLCSTDAFFPCLTIFSFG